MPETSAKNGTVFARLRPFFDISLSNKETLIENLKEEMVSFWHINCNMLYGGICPFYETHGSR
jgi:hypothetical protein